jgi:hypothetical protein
MCPISAEKLSKLSSCCFSKPLPTVHRESTPADTLATTLMVEYFNKNPYVRASMVVETGSPALVVEKSTIF